MATTTSKSKTRTRRRGDHPVVDRAAVAKVDRALAEIERRSKELEAMKADMDLAREERNLLVYRSAEALRSKTGGRPTLMELSRAMGVRHSYVSRLLEGKGHPVAAHGRTS